MNHTDETTEFLVAYNNLICAVKEGASSLLHITIVRTHPGNSGNLCAPIPIYPSLVYDGRRTTPLLLGCHRTLPQARCQPKTSSPTITSPNFLPRKPKTALSNTPQWVSMHTRPQSECKHLDLATASLFVSSFRHFVFSPFRQTIRWSAVR